MRLVIALFLVLASLIPVSATTIAPVRAAVSRVKGDLRTLGLALEAYFLDHGAYPPSSGEPDWQLGVRMLTTPVAYLEEVPLDRLKERRPIPRRFPALSVLVPLGLVLGFALTVGALLTALIHFGTMSLRRRRAKPDTLWELAFWYALSSFLALIVLSPFLFPSGFIQPTYHRLVPNEHWEDQPHGFTYWTDGSALWILISPGPDGQLDITDPRPTIAGGQIDWEFALSRYYDPTNGTLSRGDVWRVKSP